MNPLPLSAAAERNKQPILDVLRQVLGSQASTLEIAAGTGQHAEWFARAEPSWTWQPTEADAALLPLLAAQVARAGLPNLLPPLALDAARGAWPLQGPAFERRFDAIYCANMLHIAPWDACAGLMQGAARCLRADGLLVTYGPYFEGDAAAPGNIAFDRSLRERNASWGVRRLDDVVAEAQRAGLSLRQRHAMPANNLVLVFACGND